jgi:hypothetical protein
MFLHWMLIFNDKIIGLRVQFYHMTHTKYDLCYDSSLLSAAFLYLSELLLKQEHLAIFKSLLHSI